MPEPSMPTDDLYSPYSEPGGSNGAGSIYRNDSAGSYVLPLFPHQTHQPGQLMNPHTDSQSCKKSVSSKKTLFNFCTVVIQTSKT